MESGNRGIRRASISERRVGQRESGFFLKRGATSATLRVGLTRIDALDRRLAVEVDEATAVNAEIGFVLVCLRLQLLAAATELCLAINTDPYAVDLARVTDLVTSYKMAISDAVDATAKAKARAKVA